MTITTKYRRGATFWTAHRATKPVHGHCDECGRDWGRKCEPAIPRKHKVEAIYFTLERWYKKPSITYGTDFGEVDETDTMTKAQAVAECERINNK